MPMVIEDDCLRNMYRTISGLGLNGTLPILMPCHTYINELLILNITCLQKQLTTGVEQNSLGHPRSMIDVIRCCDSDPSINPSLFPSTPVPTSG